MTALTALVLAAWFGGFPGFLTAFAVLVFVAWVEERIDANINAKGE